MVILSLVIAIVTVIASTGFFTLSVVWLVRSSLSEDMRVRRIARIVEVSTGLVVLALSVASAKTQTERKLGLITVAVILAVWLFRGIRQVLAPGKP